MSVLKVYATEHLVTVQNADLNLILPYIHLCVLMIGLLETLILLQIFLIK